MMRRGVGFEGLNTRVLRFTLEDEYLVSRLTQMTEAEIEA
jgi:hypothetical protein